MVFVFGAEQLEGVLGVHRLPFEYQFRVNVFLKFEIQIKALQYFGQCLKLAKYFIFRKSYSWIKNLFVEPSYSGSNNIYISTIESIPLVSGLYSPDSWQFSKSIKSFFKAKKNKLSLLKFYLQLKDFYCPCRVLDSYPKRPFASSAQVCDASTQLCYPFNKIWPKLIQFKMLSESKQITISSSGSLTTNNSFVGIVWIILSASWFSKWNWNEIKGEGVFR